MAVTASSYYLHEVSRRYQRLLTTISDRTVGDRRDVVALIEAADACNNVADYVAVEKGFNAGKYRAELAESNVDYALVRDVADAGKHRSLHRKTRRIDSVDAIRTDHGVVRFTDENGPYYDTQKFVVIQTKDGAEHLGELILYRAIAFLGDELLKQEILAEAVSPPHPRSRYIPRSEQIVAPAFVFAGQHGQPVHEQIMMLEYDPKTGSIMRGAPPAEGIEIDYTWTVSPPVFPQGGFVGTETKGHFRVRIAPRDGPST